MHASELWIHGLTPEEVNINDTKYGDYLQRVWSLFSCVSSGIHIKELEPRSAWQYLMSCARGAMLVSHSEEFGGLCPHTRSFLTKIFL